jgi:hypothetical protein
MKKPTIKDTDIKKATGNTSSKKAASKAAFEDNEMFVPMDEPKQAEAPLEKSLGPNVVKWPIIPRPRPGSVHTFRNDETIPLKGLPEDILAYREEQKHNFVEGLVNDAYEEIEFCLADNYALPRKDQEEYDRDLHLILHTLRAVFYRQFDLEHSLHDYMDGARLVNKDGKDIWVYGLDEDDELVEEDGELVEEET